MNKTVKLISWFCAIIGTIIVFSCRKDISGMFWDKTNAGTKWAQDYFNNTLLRNQGNQVSYKTLNAVSSLSPVKKSPNIKTPMWVRARADKTPLYEFVEVPLLYTRKISPIIAKKDAPVDMEVLKASFDRLIIFKDRTGRIGQRIISFIPDKEYLKRHNGDISHNQINHLDKDFSGYLIYKTWDGIILTRLRINNGKPGKFPRSSSALPSKLNKLASLPGSISDHFGSEGEPGCTDFYYYEYEITCYYASPDETIPIYCDDPVIILQQYLYTVCPDTEPEPDPDPDPPQIDCGDPANFEQPECVSTPCDKVVALQADTTFHTAILDLRSHTPGNYEKVYTIGPHGTTTFSGTTNSPYAQYSATYPINIVAHNHFAGGEPTFSNVDLEGFAILDSLHKIANYDDFAGVVTTPYGTEYILKITDQTNFHTFMSDTFLPTSAGWDDWIDDFLDRIDIYENVDNYSVEDAYERSFLEGVQGEGLKLFKYDSTTNTYNPIKIGPFGVIVPDGC